MNSLLLCALVIVSIIGALFTTIVVIGAVAVCQKTQDDIKELKKSLDEVTGELGKINEFDHAVTDCVSGIGAALDVINNRTNWLDGINDQMFQSFGQNKDGKKS